MWLMHLFFMMMIPTVECPHVSVSEPVVRYKIHAPIHVEQPILHMYKRKGVQRIHHTRHKIEVIPMRVQK